tara:strand:+ start:1676 stop:1900 length:225 start_codon:yes stop_codon:yes gene_type:complete
MTLDQLSLGEVAEIESIETDKLPLKLIEMGCLPGNCISLIQKAPFDDPLYLKVDDSYVAIRKETAQYIHVRLKK